MAMLPLRRHQAENTVKGEDVKLRVTVHNHGAETDDVVQVYIRPEGSAFAPLNPSLCAFARVHLKENETQTMELTVPAASFTVVNEDGPSACAIPAASRCSAAWASRMNAPKNSPDTKPSRWLLNFN